MCRKKSPKLNTTSRLHTQMVYKVPKTRSSPPRPSLVLSADAPITEPNTRCELPAVPYRHAMRMILHLTRSTRHGRRRPQRASTCRTGVKLVTAGPLDPLRCRCQHHSMGAAHHVGQCRRSCFRIFPPHASRCALGWRMGVLGRGGCCSDGLGLWWWGNTGEGCIHGGPVGGVCSRGLSRGALCAFAFGGPCRLCVAPVAVLCTSHGLGFRLAIRSVVFQVKQALFLCACVRVCV